MAKSPDEMAASMVANMKEKTGKTLQQWVTIAKKSGEAKHGGILKHLKGEHGITHGFANLVAHKTLKSDAGSADMPDDLISQQYAGAKADLKPIYDALSKAASAIGKDVVVSPKKSYVSLRRNKQFALIQPSTKTRIDLGINLKDAPATERLENSGSFNAMVSHRIRLEKPSDVDKEVKSWLKKAYTQA